MITCHHNVFFPVVGEEFASWKEYILFSFFLFLCIFSLNQMLISKLLQ